MPRFSERIGVRQMPRQIQVDSMDDDLKNSLWNVILEYYQSPSVWPWAAAQLGVHLFKEPADRVPNASGTAYNWVRDRFFRSEWHETYDILEFLVQNVVQVLRGAGVRPSGVREVFIARTNVILERELSGYRFVSGQLAPISDSTEVAAIDEAANRAVEGHLSKYSTHIRSALELFGQRPTPDYRNSVKESISAVESLVNTLAGTSGNGVDEAVRILSKRGDLHGALGEAIKKLYGYSSDEEGIRHAIFDEENVGFAEAKFMLVVCSAFVNFVLDKQRDGKAESTA